MRKNRNFFLLILIFIFILPFLNCKRKLNIKDLIGNKSYNYILISVDTLRADRLECYGFSRIKTPTINEMARSGIKFERCISQTPLTLPSHTTILTGTYPFFHGVRDNGGFIVPKELQTIAELFKEKKYITGAIVGAYVLDSKWGLNQGFDFYYDRFNLDRKEGFSIADVQRRGDEVITVAINWLNKVKNNNFFLFLHLYDPHTPYEPPSPFKEKYSNDLYLGEIAYTDFQLGRLWEYLKEEKLLDKTILIFTSDHGESLGEHGEATHGFFVYQEGIHVPLIFVLPFKKLQNLIREQVVSLVDIMPTILELAKIPIPKQIQGRSLVSYFLNKNKNEDSYAYSETYYPRFHYGWSEVKSIQNEKYKLIISPDPELYDLQNDPEEKIDISQKKKGITRELEKIMNAYLKRYSIGKYEMNYKEVDEETRKKLAALGYIGTFIDSESMEGKVLPSPRNKIHIFNQISTAKELSLKGELKKAEQIMLEVIEKEPEIIDAYFVLGNICFKQKKYNEAIKWLSKALDKKPDYDFVVLNIAISYIEMEKLDKAEEILKNFVNKFQADPILYLTLGDINLKQEDYFEAIQYYKKCLEINPRSARAYNNLARVYIILNNISEAQVNALKSLSLNPALRNLHYNLAQIYELQNQLDKAEKEYLLELERFPDNYNASFNLALLYRRKKDWTKVEKYLRFTININPKFPFAYLFLGETLSLKKGKEKEAIGLIEKAVSMGLDKKHLKFAYYLLAKIYLKSGNQYMASIYARKIQQLKD